MVARVKAVEPTGLDTYVNVEIAGADAMIVIKDRLTAAAGSTVRLRVDETRAHLFDAEGIAL